MELDGFAFRSTRAAFERDRRRDGDLTASGWPVIRVTWVRLKTDGAALARELAALGIG